MTHRFPIKEIARQAGLGTATVDRVLNNRAHVSPQTRARVETAMAELSRQEQQLSARGRRLFVDVVMEAPRRFSSQVRAACEDVLPDLGEAVYRPRFQLHEQMSEAELLETLTRIRKRGSHGVLLKARDLPSIRHMVDRLDQAGVPVVTLVTDLPGSRRAAYTGIDNAKAGQTAAYLLAQVMADTACRVLTARSQDDFQGETERHQAFLDHLRTLRPGLDILEFSGGAGLPGDTRRQLGRVLQDVATVDAVYSMGGGNQSILETLSHAGLAPDVFVAHDLDRENRKLILDHQLDFILHHDLELDIRNVFDAFLSYHRRTPATNANPISTVQVLTPENIPERR
jgi:LacI family transcriptional regulator